MKLLTAIFGLITLLNFGLAAPIAVSGPPAAGNSGAGNSFAPAFSSDGRFAVFVSHANNLVTNDDHALNLDVFVRDLVLSNTLLVSVNTSGIGGGNDDANSPSISSNGQFVAFASRASNPVKNDTNDACDVFVRDITAGTTKLVSVDATGTNNALGPFPTALYPLESSYPLISANGRWVAFQSSASNLMSLPDSNRAPDVFIRDLESNVTYLVSVNDTGSSTADGASKLWSIHPDGRFVVFTSTAYDIVEGSDGESEELYVCDLQNNQTFWASSNLIQYLFPPTRVFNPVLSANGRFIAFKAQEIGDVNTFFFRHDLLTGETTLLNTNSNIKTAPSMSADGRYVAYEWFDSILLYDAQLGSNIPVTLSLKAPGYSGGSGLPTGAASTPVLTSDGGRILFLFALPANGIGVTTNTVNGYDQLYALDLTNRNAQLVSIRQDGASVGYSLSLILPVINPDGTKVAFESTDEFLVVGDNNRASDVFVRDLAAGTTDLISARHPDLPASTGAGNSWIGHNSVSADGQVVAFNTWDSNLHDLDTNRWQATYARILANSATIPVPYGDPLSRPDGTSEAPTNLFFFTRTGASVVSGCRGTALAITTAMA